MRIDIDSDNWGRVFKMASLKKAQAQIIINTQKFPWCADQRRVWTLMAVRVELFDRRIIIIANLKLDIICDTSSHVPVHVLVGILRPDHNIIYLSRWPVSAAAALVGSVL